MRRFVLQSFSALLLLVSGADALDTASLLSDPAVMELLKKKCIRATTSGLVPVSFNTAAAILDQRNLYRTVQEEYARSVSSSGKVDFPIIETTPFHYFYTNEKEQRTDIEELYRQQTQAGVFDVVFKASGKRFFGRYDVIIHVQLLDAADAGVVYVADINAYPHNGPMRFVARKSGMVDRYFRKNTADILWVARKIGLGLGSRSEFNPANRQPNQTDSSSLNLPAMIANANTDRNKT